MLTCVHLSYVLDVDRGLTLYLGALRLWGFLLSITYVFVVSRVCTIVGPRRLSERDPTAIESIATLGFQSGIDWNATSALRPGLGDSI